MIKTIGCQGPSLFYISPSLRGPHRRACPLGGLTNWLPLRAQTPIAHDPGWSGEDWPPTMCRSLPARTSQDRGKVFRRCLRIADQLQLRREIPDNFEIDGVAPHCQISHLMEQNFGYIE